VLLPVVKVVSKNRSSGFLIAHLWIDPVRMGIQHVESAYSISHRNRNLD